MLVFLYILGHNIIPVFLIIALGFLVSRRFNLNIYSLSKLTFYIFVPAFIFYNLYTAELSFDMFKILLFSVTYMAANYVLAITVSRVRKYDLAMTNAFKNAIMFNNSGNIGLSLITLVFGSAPYVIGGKTPFLNQALTAQVIILVFMNVSMNTLGFFNAGRAKMNFRDSMGQILSMPSIYAIILALILKYIKLDISSSFLWPTLIYVKDGLVPMALITLGVQLSKTQFHFMDADVNIAVFTRLVLGPALGFVFIKVFGFTGVAAQTILISYAVPTAVNTALIAVECDNKKDFASQEVMVSTIFSAVTLTTVIYAAGILFPI